MIANLVTGFRIALAAPLFGMLAFGSEAHRPWALAVFLLAGASDILDGQLARRLNQTSALGAMLDLVADRILTLAAVGGLIAGGALVGLWALPGVALVARDLIVASFNEAAPGKLGIRVSLIERVKVALQFLGLGLLIAPVIFKGQHPMGLLILTGSALLAGLTLADYARRVARALK